MMGILLRLLIGTMALAGPCLAKAHFEFQRLSMGEGLAQSSIEGLVQDRQGYLWVGTQYGLSRHDGYRFRNFQHDPEDPDSLSDSQVVDLRLAGDGRLWVATRDGLNRFDPSTGRAERFYLADDEAVSPQPSFVRQIIGEAADGSLFLRFTDGLALLRSGSSVLERLPFETPISSLGMRGMVGLLDQNERVWVLNDAGLWRLDRNASLLRLIEGVQPARRRTPMASLVESPQGQIAVVAAGGLMLIEPGPLRAGRLIRPRDYEVEADQFDAVTATSDGSFWLMSRTRFMRYRPETDSLALIDEGLPKDPLDRTTFHLNSVEVAPGEFWFATQYGVSRWYEGSRELTVFVYDPRDDHSLPPTLQRVPYRLFVDQDRTLWIGSQLGGLARLSYTARRFDHVVDQSPPGTLPFAGQNVVRAVAETASDNDFQKSVWVGLELGGIRQYQVEGDQHYDLMRVFHAGAEEARRLPGNQVEALALDPVTQRLWAAVGSSLTVIDTGTGEAILDDALSGRSDISAIQTLLFSEDGRRLWVGHSAVNEFLLDDDRLSLSESSNGAYLPELGQFNLLELADGRLVVGGLNGFSVVDFDGGRGGLSLRAQTYFTPGSREIYGLARHPDGGFWMGTRQSGLALVELRPGTAAPQLTWYDRSAGLVDDTVYAVLPEAGGRLWLSSNQGLMRFDPSSGEVRHFTPPDGVQHFEFNNTVAHEGASGRFYFGGINGLNAFDPDSIMILQQAPRLRLSSLRVNGQLRGELLTTPATVRLDHNENDLEMSFVGLHSADPERHRYQHWLEGLDEDWREVGFQRQVRYGGLGSGTYRLWARTANSDGVWSEDALLLTAMVRSPPWASAWALIGYVLLGLFAFLLFWYSIHRRQYLLEAEVMERTQELTEQQVLTRSQARELERALKSRTAFFANVSHEFRTPLTLIQASLNDLNRRLPDAPPLIRARSYLDRLVRLVDQLLNLSELQADVLREPGLPWSVTAVLGFMVRSFEPLARQRGIHLSADLQDHCLTGCSQHHVEQVALNLISNALKYSASGAEVTVRLTASDHGLVMTVHDTGPGIDPAEHKAVFERFHRAAGARASGQAGAGIGLALVRETVEALGGTIELESEPSRGSLFRVVLPGEYVPDLTIQSTALDPKALDLEVSQLSLMPPPDQLTVVQDNDEAELLLLVEDQPEIRSHLAESLSDEWQVIEAEDGKQGLERARRDQPSLIVSDVMMPGMDGFQMLARLRDDLATSHIPVMLLTARHDRDSRMKGLMLSADDFMGKPFDIDELQVRLRRMRDNRKRLQRFLLDGGSSDLPASDEERAPDLSARDIALLESLQDWLSQTAEDPAITVEDMASAVALETRTLQRKLRALTGQTPSDFIRHFRLQQAIELLLQTDRSIHDIALSCGFSNPQTFSRTFSREYGQPPDRWRKNRGSTDSARS